ncbi:hypothetical protein LINPERPRIM_LOCUS13431 [Linum perenne]
MVVYSCSDGFFFAIKEVSLLDQGSQAKQSIMQLEQVIGCDFSMLLHLYACRLPYGVLFDFLVSPKYRRLIS